MNQDLADSLRMGQDDGSLELAFSLGTGSWFHEEAFRIPPVISESWWSCLTYLERAFFRIRFRIKEIWSVGFKLF